MQRLYCTILQTAGHTSCSIAFMDRALCVLLVDRCSYSRWRDVEMADRMDLACMLIHGRRKGQTACCPSAFCLLTQLNNLARAPEQHRGTRLGDDGLGTPFTRGLLLLPRASAPST